ncbi:uncharacterized protein PgNI_08508 [Pyricularia grisea]|uniref:Uncharacterized protein n=1 Tax=Pyricularia grisea TaxID=148305 RepID=A0A6P8AW43_PYRGI|nr:uncharacterized protein PgNI_08508 [Pyricularia grisea]TLD06412.1 hypothetical protein PgNI_08508 [Pyricularia grisea]
MWIEGHPRPQAWKASFAKGKPSVTQRDGVTSKFGPTVGGCLASGFGICILGSTPAAKHSRQDDGEIIATCASLACIGLPLHGQACLAALFNRSLRLYEKGCVRVHAEPPCHTLKEGFTMSPAPACGCKRIPCW